MSAVCGLRPVCALLLAVLAGAAAAQPSNVSDKVIVSGSVPDDATRQAILAKVKEVYGADRVVDQLGVEGKTVTPPNWAQNVSKLISPELKQVSRGRLKIAGNVVEIDGEVKDDGTRQQIVGRVNANLNPTYSVRSSLRVAAPGQDLLDAALAHRTIAFEPGNAVITPSGRKVLDDLAPVLQQFKGRRFEVIGHTDSQGLPQNNLTLSAQRAEAVKAYLGGKGTDVASIAASGRGADQPVASNDTPEGRARNRRIEFRVLP